MTGKTCPQCAKVFSRPGVMRAHLKAVHLGEKPFQCPRTCARTPARSATRAFHKAADLKKHLAIHARKGFVHRSSREVRASGACGL